MGLERCEDNGRLIRPGLHFMRRQPSPLLRIEVYLPSGKMARGRYRPAQRCENVKPGSVLTIQVGRYFGKGAIRSNRALVLTEAAEMLVFTARGDTSIIFHGCFGIEGIWLAESNSNPKLSECCNGGNGPMFLGGIRVSDDRKTRLAKAEGRMRLLPGVTRVRILELADGDEIHVMVEGCYDQDEIKRLKKDIETVYLLETGESIDYRRISIAQIREKHPDDHAGSNGRPVLSRISVEYGQGGAVVAYVDIEFGGECYSGSANGRTIEEPLSNIVKRATLKSIEKLLGEKYALQADCEIADGRVISEITLIDSSSGQRQRYLGAAYKRDDISTAVARSILQALNRQFELLVD